MLTRTSLQSTQNYQNYTYLIQHIQENHVHQSFQTTIIDIQI